MKKGNYDEMRLGAITFLDVLGWKGIWRSKPDACQKLIEIIKSAIKIEADHQKTLSNLEHLKELKNLDTGLLSISDTIVIYTYGDSYFSLLMHGIICAWIIPHSIFEGIPFRGATNYGEFQIEGNILVGPAIDEVASWYEFGEWVGVMLTPSALLTTNLSNFYGGKEQKASFNDYFCKYNAPIKKGKLETYCVNWPQYFIPDNAMVSWESKDHLLDKFISMGPLTPEISSKISNTLVFYEEREKFGCYY